MHLSRQRELTELEQLGLIQEFAFTHELAWNVLKDYVQGKGFSDVIGSRDATSVAFQNGLIADGVTPAISSWRNPSLPRSSAAFPRRKGSAPIAPCQKRRRAAPPEAVPERGADGTLVRWHPSPAQGPTDGSAWQEPVVEVPKEDRDCWLPRGGSWYCTARSSADRLAAPHFFGLPFSHP